MKARLLYCVLIAFLAQALFTSAINAQCCKLPDSLKVKNITDSSFCLKWHISDTSHCDTAKAFQVKFRPVGDSVWHFKKGSYGGLTTHTFCDSAKACTKYEWKVRNICIKNGDSTFTAYVTGPNFTTTCDTAHKRLTAVSNTKLEKLHALKVTPNPARGLIVISGEFEGKVFISVSNMIGKKLYERNITTQGKLNLPLNVSNFQNGFYFITVTNGKGVYKTNFLKQ